MTRLGNRFGRRQPTPMRTPPMSRGSVLAGWLVARFGELGSNHEDMVNDQLGMFANARRTHPRRFLRRLQSQWTENCLWQRSWNCQNLEPGGRQLLGDN